jgi:hypothetical protein
VARLSGHAGRLSVAATAAVADTHWQCSMVLLPRASRSTSRPSLLELAYLAESSRLTAEQVGLVDEALHAMGSAFEVHPVDEEVARAVADIPRAEVSNPDGTPAWAVSTNRTL